MSPVAQPSLADLIGQYELGRYEPHAIALLALMLRFQIEDITLTATKAITDHPDDKKCDLIYIDELSDTAVIGQSYVSTRDRNAAPANKASDLNTAAGWVLSRNIADIPETIREQAQELQEKLSGGQVRFLEFWYVHNLPSSANVSAELETVRENAANALRTRFPDIQCDVIVREIGADQIVAWWKAAQADVAIDETLDVPINDGYLEQTEDWKAVITSVPAKWLRDLFKTYSTDLFKGNVRDYLGIRGSEKNINNNMRQTVNESPKHFLIYNNGVSIITRSAEFDRERRQLRINGISIVNGAQTTGVLGNLSAEPSEDARVQARFISLQNRELVQKVIRFNNSQNKVEAADFRSTDPTQTRLRAEFQSQYPEIVYLGGRRGGSSDAMARNSQVIDSNEVAKSLAAFHGDPTLAYNRVKELWNDENYIKIFPHDNITAGHVTFVYSLYRAIAKYKDTLKASAESERTASQKEQLSLLRYGAAFYVLMAGIGRAIEPILGRAVSNKFNLKFSTAGDIDTLVSNWEALVKIVMPFLRNFRTVIDEGLKNEAAVTEELGRFSSTIEALAPSLGEQLRDFRQKVAA